MPNAAEKLISLDEFLAWEREQPERYEYAGGVVTMMAGGTVAHVTIALNVALAIREALRGTQCRPFGSDMKVVANNTVRYPDISVTCRPVEDDERYIAEPILIIEIVSPSTEREDRGRKKFDYFATPSIQQYAIIEQDRRRIDFYTRSGTGWTNEIVEGDATLKLSPIGLEISLDTIYEDTDLDITRQRAGGQPAPAR